VQGNILEIADIDVLDGTPLLYLKPYLDQFDGRVSNRQGWLDVNVSRLPGKQDDGCFTG
jgi:tRNA (Thr-GGU) A37 N-methylase